MEMIFCDWFDSTYTAMWHRRSIMEVDISVWLSTRLSLISYLVKTIRPRYFAPESFCSYIQPCWKGLISSSDYNKSHFYKQTLPFNKSITMAISPTTPHSVTSIAITPLASKTKNINFDCIFHLRIKSFKSIENSEGVAIYEWGVAIYEWRGKLCLCKLQFF